MTTALPSRPTPFTLADLEQAWQHVADNAGCAGADGVTVQQFARRVPRNLEALLATVHSGGYRPSPLLQMLLEKRPGSPETRELLIPTVQDRILQTAAARQLSRSFEEEFLDSSFAYRPGRSVDRAIARIAQWRDRGLRYVVHADIRSFFDTVNHKRLVDSLAKSIDPELLPLVSAWVRAFVWDGHRLRRLKRGLPQGSPLSPLLANFFLQPLDVELSKSESRTVRYADDFLILCADAARAEAAQTLAAAELARLGLRLNTAKTAIATFEQGLDFLGAHFQGGRIWTPWMNRHAKGRIVFFAKPMPARLRARFEHPPAGGRPATRRSPDNAPPPARLPQNTPQETFVAYLYLTMQGAVLRKSGDRVLVEKEQHVELDLPYHKLEHVLLFGDVQVTSQAMGELLEKGVSLSLFTRHGAFRGSLTPPQGKNVLLRLRQFDMYRDPEKTLVWAREILAAKLAAAQWVLARWAERHPDVSLPVEQTSTLAHARNSVAEAASAASLLGLEGAAAHAYFANLMLFNRSPFPWRGRLKHPAPDPLNALLSLTYSLLTNELAGLLEAAGLDASIGFLHEIDYGRPSLALDLVELFRHPVADRFVLTTVNRGAFSATDFDAYTPEGAAHLTHDAMKRYFALYEQWMTLRGSAAGSRSWRDRLRSEVRALAAALRDGGAWAPETVPEEDDPCATWSATI